MKRLLALPLVALIVACQRDSTAPSGPMALSASSFAPSATSRTPFVAFAFTCEGDESELLEARSTGNMLHLKSVGTGHAFADNPMMTGPFVVRVSVNVNLRDPAAPTGDFTGSLIVSPSGFAGTWEGSFGGHLNGGRWEGDPFTPIDAHIVAQGTGVFAGMKIMFDHQVNPAFEPPPAPAGCTSNDERWGGIILNPAG